MTAAAAGLPPWLRGVPGGWRVSVWVQPGATRTEAAGEYGGCLKLRIAAPPIEGRANESVRRFVADRLGISRDAVQIEHGASSRRKRVRVETSLAASVLLAALGG